MMSKNELDKLDHTLSAINEIGSKSDDILEKKKNEQVMSVGGVVAAREMRDAHEKFLESSKEALIEEVKSGKIPEAVGNYVMSWLKRSNEVVKKFIVDKTAQMNIRAGEVAATENSIRLLKSYYDSVSDKKNQELNRVRAAEEEAKRLASAPTEPPLAAPTFADMIPDMPPPPPPKKIRKIKDRPDEVGPLSKTVKRIKESRKTRSGN